MPPTVERKLTTVLCADVEGYSRLMDRDEVGTLEILKRHRDALAGLIERHRGRVVNTWGIAAHRRLTTRRRHWLSIRGRFHRRATAAAGAHAQQHEFLQLRREVLGSTEVDDAVDLDVVVSQHAPEVAIDDRKLQVPAHRLHDDFCRESEAAKYSSRAHPRCSSCG